MRQSDDSPRPALLKWLLDSDPGIRWQAMRDLTDRDAETIAVERARIATEGWGARLLSLQSPAGHWGGPKEDHGLLTTLYSLVVLMDLGLDPAGRQARKMMDRVDKRLVFRPLKNRPFLDGETEPCINGRILAVGAYFKEPNDALARLLLSQQLDDGGWNCDAVEPSAKHPLSRRSSFHTTICVLEGLLEYERAVGGAQEIAEARRRGEEYLLERSLFRRRSTGEVANAEFLELAFPPRYHYDILRALDYFRAAGARPDARMAEAVEVVESKRQADGRWLLDRAYDEALAVPVGERVGEPSRWNTLRAMRVLRWYEDR